MRMFGWLVGMVLVVPLGLASVVLAFGAFPIGVWVGWRVASGSWLWAIDGDPVLVGRVLVGIVVGMLLYRFGVMLRLGFVREFSRKF